MPITQDTYTDDKIAQAMEAEKAKMTDAQRWPDWVPDLEALGVLAYLSSLDGCMQADPELFPGRVADLGKHEEGWSLGLMLRRIYEGANEATRKAIDGDALGIPRHLWDLMTGDVVEI